jgi:histidyl-tRNA synthetase
MCRRGTHVDQGKAVMKIDNSPARGMRDLLPADVAVRDHVLESISAVYRRFGYQRIETPALENIARLSSGEGGDNEKLIFEVLRRRRWPRARRCANWSTWGCATT